MTTVALYEAKTHLSQLVDRAAKGEDIIIGKAGKPMVRLGLYISTAAEPRRPGSWRGCVTIHDGFDVRDPRFVEYVRHQAAGENQMPPANPDRRTER